MHPSDAARPTLEQLRERAALVEAARLKLFSVGDGFGYNVAVVATNAREAEQLAADAHEGGNAISWLALEVPADDLARSPRLAAAYRAASAIGVLTYDLGERT